MMIKAFLTSLLVLTITCVQAQTEKRNLNEGIIIGGALGYAHSNHSFPTTTLSSAGFALSIKMGYMVKPNLALLLSSNVSGYEYSGIGRDRKRDFGILAPSVQYWFHKRLWAMAGVGIGVDAPVFFDIQNPDTNVEETKYYAGFGAIGAFGYEIYRGKSFAFDLQARLTYRKLNIAEGSTQGFSPALLLGINLY